MSFAQARRAVAGYYFSLRHQSRNKPRRASLGLWHVGFRAAGALVWALFSGLSAGVAFAATLSEPIALVAQAVQEGQYAKAATALESALKLYPQNPQLRLAQGVVAHAQGRSTEAIRIFQGLTQQYPNAPEAHNNLAVVYASLGRMDMAQHELRRALATRQAYATSWQNLSSLEHVGAFSPKLKLLGEWSQGPSGATGAITATMPAPKPTGMQTQPDLPLLSEVSRNQKPRSSALTPTTRSSSTEARAMARNVHDAAKTPPARNASRRSVNARMSAQNREIARSVRRWAKAWQQQNMQDYFASYALDFRPHQRASRIAWQAQRRARILHKRNIRIHIEQLHIARHSNTRAGAHFVQHYRASGVQLRTHKWLQLERHRGVWKIVRER